MEGASGHPPELIRDIAWSRRRFRYIARRRCVGFSVRRPDFLEIHPWVRRGRPSRRDAFWRGDPPGFL